MQKKILFGIIIIVVIVFLVGAVWAYIKNVQFYNIPDNVQNLSSETAGWKTYKNFGIQFQYPKTLGDVREIVVARGTNILFGNNLSVVIASAYNNETRKFDTFDQIVNKYINSDAKQIYTLDNFYTNSEVKGRVGSYRYYTSPVGVKAGFVAYFPMGDESYIIFSADYNFLSEDNFYKIISTFKFTK